MNRTRTLSRVVFCLIVGPLLLGALAGGADGACIHFDDTTTSLSGSMDYSTVGGPLVGTDIHLDMVEGCGTPLNPGVVLTLVGGNLDFATGNLINYNSTIGLWTFGGGGSFDIWATAAYYTVGGVDTYVVGSSTNTTEISLASGQFGATQVAFHQTFPNTIAFTGQGTDQKAESIVDFYGLGLLDFVFSQTSITAQLAKGLPAADGTFTSSVDETDVKNYPVPEPSTALIWSVFAGVIGLGAGLRRRKGRAKKTRS